jgi:hypothetical protein
LPSPGFLLAVCFLTFVPVDFFYKSAGNPHGWQKYLKEIL